MNQLQDKLPIGTKIIFTETIIESASEDHPTIQFARKGDHGEVIGHNDFEGHTVKSDSWEASFGAVLGKEFKRL